MSLNTANMLDDKLLSVIVFKLILSVEFFCVGHVGFFSLKIYFKNQDASDMVI